MFNLLTSNIGEIITNIAPIVIILIFALISLKIGFAKSFLKTFGTILAIILSLLLCVKCAEFLQNKFGFVDTVTGWIDGTLTKIFGEDLMNGTLAEATKTKLSEAGVADWIINLIMSAKDSGSATLTSANIGEVICPAFAYYIVMGISAVGLFIIFKIIFFLIGNTIKALHAIKPIKFVDGFLGFLLGIIKGVVFVQIITIILGAMPFDFCNTAMTYINTSPVMTTLNSFNVFSYVMSIFSGVNIIDLLINNTQSYLHFIAF